MAAATLFTVAVLVHNGDHLRRGGGSVSASVFWIGTAGLVVEVLLVVLVFARHRLAPLLCVVGGGTLAAGYVFVHFTPARTWLSDSFLSGRGAVVSIAAALFETTAAVLLALAGWRASRSGTSEVAPEGILPTLGHPVVAVMLVGNAVVLAGSLASRWL
jgi:hypothetical protein